jgi:hypothetical protein
MNVHNLIEVRLKEVTLSATNGGAWRILYPSS